MSMKVIQNLTVGANYLDELFTRDELLKSGCFKESSLDKYVKKLISLSLPLSVQSAEPKKAFNAMDSLRAEVLENLGHTVQPKSDFSGDIETIRFPLGFVKGCTAYSTFQLYLICWLQERMKKREPINNTKLRLLRNEPEVLFNDDTMQNPVTQAFKQVLITVKDYRNNPEKYLTEK